MRISVQQTYQPAPEQVHHAPAPTNQEILERMAVYFTHLETLENWPPTVRTHSEVWVALMGLELPQVQTS